MKILFVCDLEEFTSRKGSASDSWLQRVALAKNFVNNVEKWLFETKQLGRSPTSSNAVALVFRVSVLFFEAKSHLHFVFAFTLQR